MTHDSLKSQKRICPYSRKCGGCQLQNMTYEKQLEFKQKLVISLLKKYGYVEKIIPMEYPFHYRNKVQAMFFQKGKTLMSGIYQSSDKTITAVDGCLIEDETADRIIATVTKLGQSFKYRAYNSETGRGFLRHILVKHGFLSGQVMVVLVTTDGEFKSQRSFINALLQRHPEITTIVRSINNQKDGLFLGENEEILFGNGYIEEQLCGKTFRISPQSFYQVNPVQTEVLYNKAAEYAALTGKETLLDCYCGTGTIGIIMADKARHVIGAELNADAVTDAKANARINNTENIEFICRDAGEFMTELAQNNQNADVVVTDPPRAGCSKAFLQSLVKLSPMRVVYVSCNPNTLARDLQYLTENGYKTMKIQPVDMFPYTKHIETVVLLSKLKSK